MAFFTFEIIGILFAAVMIYLAYFEFKRKKLAKIEYIAWIVFWLLGSVLILLHNQFTSILQPLQIMRALDLYMILSFMALFASVFYLYLKNKRTELRLADLTRALALKPLNQKRFDDEK